MKQTIMESRKAVVCVRLLGRNSNNGSVTSRVVAGVDGDGARVQAAVVRIFANGADRLSAEEWLQLFETKPCSPPDTRWPLLVRLATDPQGKEGELKDQFVALPDGTAFSMRLLLLIKQSGKPSPKGASSTDKLPFNRLPDIARLVPFVTTLISAAAEAKAEDLARSVEEQAKSLGLPVSPLVNSDIYRFRDKIKRNGGESWFAKEEQDEARDSNRKKPGRAKSRKKGSVTRGSAGPTP